MRRDNIFVYYKAKTSHNRSFIFLMYTNAIRRRVSRLNLRCVWPSGSPSRGIGDTVPIIEDGPSNEPIVFNRPVNGSVLRARFEEVRFVVHAINTRCNELPHIVVIPPRSLPVRAHICLLISFTSVSGPLRGVDPR